MQMGSGFPMILAQKQLVSRPHSVQDFAFMLAPSAPAQFPGEDRHGHPAFFRVCFQGHGSPQRREQG